MKNYLFIIIISLLFFFSCSQKDNSKNEEQSVYEIVDVKKLSFPLDNSKKGKPLDFYIRYNNIFDYCYIDNIETLIIPINQDRLAFYDLDTKKEYHSVPLLKDRSIKNFSYINKDSIFVFYEINYRENDTTLEDIYIQLLDYNGESKICDYEYDLSNFKDSIDIRTPFLIERTMHPIIADNNVFFLPQVSTINNIGTADFFKKQIPLFARYNSITNKINFSKSIAFPDISEGIYYNTYHTKINYCLSEKKLPVLRFFYSSTLYEWDYNNDKIIKHSLKSKIIDSIPPLYDEYALPQSLKAVYGQIYYDKYNKIYYSLAFLNDILYGKTYTLLVIADENFNYLGEILNPPFGGNVEFYDGNIISYLYYNDSIRVYYDKLTKTNKPLKPYLDSVNNLLKSRRKNLDDNFKSYEKNNNTLQTILKQKFPQIEDDYVLLTLFAKGSCPSCVDMLKQTLSDNYTIFKDFPLYVVYSGSSDELLDIKYYENLEKLNLFKDTLKLFKILAINEKKFNSLDPRLTVVENNQIILDSNYGFNHIQSGLIPTMLSYLNKSK